MTTLQTQNYIHTLLACHFRVPFDATTIVRNYLQEGMLKEKLYVDWVDLNISQLSIPKFKYQDYWLLFENYADMGSYKEWRQNNIATSNNIKYMCAGPNSLVQRFYIFLQGLANTYYLEIHKVFTGELRYRKVYVDHKVNFNPFTVKVDEQTFYSEVEHLLDILKTTNKLPFDLFNVK